MLRNNNYKNIISNVTSQYQNGLERFFGLQKPLWDHPNVESADMKLRLMETFWRFWSAPVFHFAETPFSARNSNGAGSHNPKCNKYVRINISKTCLEKIVQKVVSRVQFVVFFEIKANRCSTIVISPGSISPTFSSNFWLERPFYSWSCESWSRVKRKDSSSIMR